ncbi:MAG: hypothetical protein AAF787_10920 [Chloroflexota bacterium]
MELLNKHHTTIQQPGRVIYVQNSIILTLHAFDDVVHLPLKPFQIKVIAGTARIEGKHETWIGIRGQSTCFATNTVATICNHESHCPLTVKIAMLPIEVQQNTLASRKTDLQQTL